MLSSHEKLAQRLASFEMTVAPAIDALAQSDNAGLSATDSIKRNQFGFVFEEELNGSWVYQRASRQMDGSSSIISSAGRTASWSMLTGLSLSDISNLAVLALPVYAEDISNRELYQFGQVHVDSVKPAIEAGSGPNPIFGVPLQSSLEVDWFPARVLRTDSKGEFFVAYYVPGVVARCCAYIKEEGKY